MSARRTEHAKRLVEDELLNEAFDSVREKMVRSIESSPLGSEIRLDLQMGLQMLRQVRQELERFLKAEKLDDFYEDRA